MNRSMIFALALVGVVFPFTPANAANSDVNAASVVKHYADIAEAKYNDALTSAKTLVGAVDVLIANPNEDNLSKARSAWLSSRIPYQQTEVYRFGNPIVDDWEGRVNAWPLDEGLIDYVEDGYGTESDENTLYSANVIANKSLTVNGKTIDASKITPEFLSNTLHEAGGIEANVATGYHAIEFLLWGQDLNGTDAGSGQRPASDYSMEDCTNENCDRRRDYLEAALQLLVSDLTEMAANWAHGGSARINLEGGKANAGISAILTGMGSLSYGELAGERMKLGLLLHDPEEEHDCFSDNTANSHLYDAMGIQNVYLGTYTRIDGTNLTGPSLSKLVRARDPAVDADMKDKLAATLAAMTVMASRAEKTEAYDQMIGEDNIEGNAIVQAAIDGLIVQTKSIERVMTALDLGSIELEGSESLDSPSAIFK